MPSATLVSDFEGFPPFPDDVPTAPLLRLSLRKLLSGDADESARLFRACVELGFFYLDVRDVDEGEKMLKEADSLFRVGEEIAALPVEEKRKYDFSGEGLYFGYKGYGRNYIDKMGNIDRNEFYNVSKDDIQGLSPPLPAPSLLLPHRPLLSSYMTHAQHIISLVLTELNTHLHLPPDTLTRLHQPTSASGDQVRFICAPAQPPNDRRASLGEHTDFGSITILFNRLGGLQVLPPGADAEWCYVRPLPGHAVVNLGDAMAKFTNGLLRSNIHRVVAPPGAQAECTRYSLVYFSRPQNGVLLKRLEGSDVIPELQGEEEAAEESAAWVKRRALGTNVKTTKLEDLDKAAGTEALSRRIN